MDVLHLLEGSPDIGGGKAGALASVENDLFAPNYGGGGASAIDAAASAGMTTAPCRSA
jgi:hypothetical protein